MKRVLLFCLLLVANFTFAQNFTTHLIDDTTGDALSTKITDLDNDGDLDLVVAYYNTPSTTNTGKLIWYENDGMQNYSMHAIDTAIDGAIYVTVVDANGDGNKDLLVNAFDGDALFLYVSNGDSPLTFLPRFTIDASADGSNYSAAADLDGDSVLDALSANYYVGELVWYKWDGAVSVIKNVIDASVPLVSSVETGDIDGDSDIDLIVAAGNDLIWYENNGSAAFTKHIIPSSAGFTDAITAYFVDFDGDSDMDIIASAATLDEVAWFENDGSQVFTKHVVGTGIDYAAYGMAVDFNNDGKMDVVVSATNTNELLWFENDGTNLVFTQHVAASAADVGDAYAIDVNDIDGDGDVDVALTSPGPNKVFWIENDFIAIPENNLIANAIPIACGDVLMGNTKDATNEIGEGNCTDVYDDSKDVWYTFNGFGYDVNVTTCSTNTLFDTAIAVYTGTPGNLTCLVDNDDDDNCGNDYLSTVTFTADGTSTYYIKVQGFDSTEFGQFQLSVDCTVVSVTDLQADFDFEFYPNPVQDSLTIKANEIISNVIIYNMLGQVVKKEVAPSRKLVIDTSKLSNGTYIVKATIQDKVGTFQMVK